MATRVLITGAGGLVGHGIATHFLQKGWEVYGTFRNPPSVKRKGFTPLALDLCSEKSLQAFAKDFPKVDVVVHSAALIPVRGADNARAYYDTNFNGTLRILELVSRENLPLTFISASPSRLVQPLPGITDEELYPFTPTHPYYASKAAAELACREVLATKKIPSLSILRITAPYGYVGERAAVIPKFVDLARTNKTITLMGTGAREQIFTFVEDVGFACDCAYTKRLSGTFNITGGERMTMRQLAEQVISVFDSRSEIVFSGKPDPEEGKSLHVSHQKAATTLGYRPLHKLVDGLKKIKAYLASENSREISFPENPA